MQTQIPEFLPAKATIAPKPGSHTRIRKSLRGSNALAEASAEFATNLEKTALRRRSADASVPLVSKFVKLSPIVAKVPPIEKHPFISKLSAHASFNSDDVKALGRVLNNRVTVKKGKDIIVQGLEHQGLDVIESGFAIRCTLLRKGGRQIISTLLPGDIVGFPASFSDRSIFSVVATSEMGLHRISLATLVELCRERPNIAIALIGFAAWESALHAHHLVNAGRRSPLERVAHFILEMHFRLKVVGLASENSFEMPLSQEGIGDTVGLSAPHVNRMLKELKRDGLIAIEGREIRIRDRAPLQIIAEFDSSYLARASFQKQTAKW